MSHNRDLSAAAAQLGFHSSNIGIGSETPQNRLDVAGDVKILDNSPRLFFYDANANGASSAPTWQSAGMTHSNKTSSYTLTASDDNRLITTTSNVTIPSGVFSAANGTTIYNNSSSTISIVQGSGVTLRLSGSNVTGTRSLVQRGVCTVMCVASNQFIITGSGLA